MLGLHMAKIDDSPLRILSLIFFSLLMVFNQTAMASTMSTEHIVMSAGCEEMMEHAQSSAPLHAVDHHMNHCAGSCCSFCVLAASSANAVAPLSILQSVLTLSLQSQYLRTATDGYFSLPDPPPRYSISGLSQGSVTINS
jgi:hypothetical protein